MRKFTWADLKKAANEIPEELLNQEVVVWEEDEGGCKIAAIDALEEDYRFDGDEGCAPASVLMEDYDGSDFDDDHYIIYPKGARILIALTPNPTP
jgi:hypothetical protein